MGAGRPFVSVAALVSGVHARGRSGTAAATERERVYKPPKEIARAGIETGSTKAKLSWDKAMIAGFLAGA
jgi:hypothetical protein